MRIGVHLRHWEREPHDVASLARLAEDVGLESVWVSETWGSDAVGLAAWIAAHTERIAIGTGVLQMPARTPAAAAMAAMTLDHLAAGRLRLGLGVSGPQVVEGWHGAPFGSTLARTREYVAIVRTALASREPLTFDGDVYALPVPGGMGRPLKMNVTPLRPEVPIYLAAMGPRNVALTCEIADGWLPLLFCPERVDAFGLPPLREGFDVAPMVLTAIDDDVTRARDEVRPQIALYVGAFGSRARNFYAELVRRYGFGSEVDEIQAAALDGRMADATAAVTDRLVDALTLAGPVDAVRDRLAAYEDAGATSLLVMTKDAATIRALERCRRMTEADRVTERTDPDVERELVRARARLRGARDQAGGTAARRARGVPRRGDPPRGRGGTHLLRPPGTPRRRRCRQPADPVPRGGGARMGRRPDRLADRERVVLRRSDLRDGDGGAAGAMDPTALRRGPTDDGAGDHGTGRGFGRGRHHDDRPARGGRLRPRRREDLGERGADREHLPRVRHGRPRHPVQGHHIVRRRAWRPGLHAREEAPQDGLPLLSDRRARVLGLLRARGAAGRRGGPGVRRRDAMVRPFPRHAGCELARHRARRARVRRRLRGRARGLRPQDPRVPGRLVPARGREDGVGPGQAARAARGRPRGCRASRSPRRPRWPSSRQARRHGRPATLR